MIVKYNRTSHYSQQGKRFEIDKRTYDLTLFDKGVSGKVPLFERPKGTQLWELIKQKKVHIVVFEDFK